MNWDFFHHCAASNYWALLTPEILLILAAIFILALEWLIPADRIDALAKRCACMSFFGVAGMIIWFWWIQAFFRDSLPQSLVVDLPNQFLAFSGSIFHTSHTPFLRIFFLLAGWLTLHLVDPYFKRKNFSGKAFYPLLLWVTASFMLLIQCYHFLTFFIVLESATIGLYILIAYQKDSTFSLEASLKYLIMGGVSSALLLMGVALLYGAATNPLLPGSVIDGLNFGALHLFIAANSTNPLVLMGCGMVLVSVLFKIGAVPLHLWIPDVYQGAFLPTTALLAVASKGAGIFVLMNLLHGPFAALQDRLAPVLLFISCLTIIVGNATALGQPFVKRIVGLSGVSHAGYLLLGVVTSFYIDWASFAVCFYLFVYLIASFSTFSVMSQVAALSADEALQSLHDFNSLSERNGFLGLALTSGLASLAGVPPFAGFVAKFLILLAVFKSGFYWSFGLALLGVLLSFYYYFNWMRVATFLPWRTKSSDNPSPIFLSPSHYFVLTILVAFTLVSGLLPAWIF